MKRNIAKNKMRETKIKTNDNLDQKTETNHFLRIFKGNLC